MGNVLSRTIGPPSVVLIYLATAVFMESVVLFHLPICPDAEGIYCSENCEKKTRV